MDGFLQDAVLVSNRINQLTKSARTHQLFFKCFPLPSPAGSQTSTEMLAWHPQDSPHSFCSHLIKVGGVLRFCPVCSQVTPPHVICQNDHEIWLLASCFPTGAKIHKGIKASQESHPQEQNLQKKPAHGEKGRVITVWSDDGPQLKIFPGASPCFPFRAGVPGGQGVPGEQWWRLQEDTGGGGRRVGGGACKDGQATEMRPAPGILIQESQDTCNLECGCPTAAPRERTAVCRHQTTVTTNALWPLREQAFCAQGC